MYTFLYFIIPVILPLCSTTSPAILELGSVYSFQVDTLQAIIPNNHIDRAIIITLSTGNASVPTPLLFAGYDPWPNATNFLWTNRGVNIFSKKLQALSTLIDMGGVVGSNVYLTVVSHQSGAMFFLNPERPVLSENANTTGYVQVHQRKWFVHRNSGMSTGPSLYWLDQCDAVTPGHMPDVLTLQWGLYNSLNNWNDTYIYNFDDSIPLEPLGTHSQIHFEGNPQPSVMVEVDDPPNAGISESYFFLGAFPAGMKVQDQLLEISYRMGYSLGRVTLSTELQAYRLGDNLYLGIRAKDLTQKIGNIKVYTDGTADAISFWNNFGNSFPRYYMNSACFLHKYSSTFSIGITPRLVYWNSDIFTLSVVGFYSKMANQSNSMVNVVISEPDGYFARKATMAPLDELKPMLPCDPGDDSPFFWPFIAVSAVALIIFSSSVVTVGKLVHKLNLFKKGKYSIVN